MEKLYEDSHVSIFYDESNQLLVDVWTESSEELEEEAFKSLLQTWASFMKKHQIPAALTDTSRFKLPMTPEVQVWTTENITKPLFADFPYRKHAFLMPEEFIANLSIEQFTVETNESAAETRFFCKQRRSYTLVEEPCKSRRLTLSTQEKPKLLPAKVFSL